MRVPTGTEVEKAQHLDAVTQLCWFTGQRDGSAGPIMMAVLTLLPRASGATDADRVAAFEAVGKKRAGKPQEADKAVEFWQRRKWKVAHGFVLGPGGPERVRTQEGVETVETVHPNVAYHLRLNNHPVPGPVYRPAMHPEWPLCSPGEQQAILQGKNINSGVYGRPPSR